MFFSHLCIRIYLINHSLRRNCQMLWLHGPSTFRTYTHCFAISRQKRANLTSHLTNATPVDNSNIQRTASARPAVSILYSMHVLIQVRGRIYVHVVTVCSAGRLTARRPATVGPLLSQSGRSRNVKCKILSAQYKQPR
jgi:hypothetical protein